MRKNFRKTNLSDETVVSKLKLAVEELRKRTQFLELVIDNIPAPVWVKDTNSKHLLINKAYLDNMHIFRPFFTSKDEILGKTDHELVPKSIADAFRRADKEAIEKSIGISKVEVPTTGIDGMNTITIPLKKVLKDTKGKATHFIGTWFDITESKRMEKISIIKERLRSLPGMSTGLDLILDTALDDFGRDVGIILTVDDEEGTAKLQTLRGSVEDLEVGESYPLDGGFAELEAIRKGKSMSKIVEEFETSILGTPSISCVPVYLGKKLYGLLALGDLKGRVLMKGNLNALGLYGDLISMVFETQALSIKPIKETVKERKRKFNLDPGYSYLVKGKVEEAFKIFVDQVLGGWEGLCITREYPPRIRKRYGLDKTPMVWLREEKAKDEKTIHSLQDLSIMLREFLNKAKQGVVLLDGFEYLVINHEFKPCIQFLQLARSRFEENNGIFITPIYEGSLEEKNSRLLERELKLFTAA